MRARWVAVTGTMLCLLCGVRAAQAQRSADITVGVSRSEPVDLRGSTARSSRGGAPGEAERRRWAPVASLLMPGTGQALLHQDRFIAYLALEAWAGRLFARKIAAGSGCDADYETDGREEPGQSGKLP